MKTIHWILLAVLAISVSSCHKIDRYPLDAVAKQVIPYQLGETVFFVDEGSDSVALDVVRVEDMWDIEDEAYSEVWVQYREVNMVSADNKFQFTFQAEAKCPRYLIKRCFRVHFKKPYSHTLMTPYDDKGNLSCGTVWDSLPIGEKIYYDVAEINETYGNGTVQHTMQCRYNKEYGLLQLKMDGKIHLQRIP